MPYFELLKKHITFSDEYSVHKISRDLLRLSGHSVNPSHIYKKSFKPLKLLKLIFTRFSKNL